MAATGKPFTDEEGIRWVVDAKTGALRRWYPSTWIAADFVQERIGDSHPYVSAFLHEPFLARVRARPNWRSLLNHKGLAKEVSEAYSVVRRVEALVADLCGGDWARAAVFDVGCGKGFLGTVLSGSHPSAAVFLVDRSKYINMGHLADVPNAEFSVANVMRDANFLREFVERKTAAGRVAIICGIHLCGLLAEKLISTYIEAACVRGLVLVPCCLCSHKRSDVCERARPLSAALDNYVYWSLHLLHLLPRDATHRRGMEEDDLMMSVKNRVITASKLPPRVFNA